MATIYRATTDGYTGPWSCWATTREDAEAYTEEGVGHGGEEIIEAEVELDDVLDMAERKPREAFRTLAAALGYEDPLETAQQWMESGYLYPWEESREVREALEESEYRWIRLIDDYPEEAETLVSLRGIAAEQVSRP